MKRKILILSIVISLLMNNVVFGANGYNWKQSVVDGNIEWYYIGDTGRSDPRWIKDFGYTYYIGDNNKLVVGQLDSEHFLNDGSVSDLPYGALVEENKIKVDEKETSDKSTSYLEVKREQLNNYDNIVIILHGLSGVKEEYKYYGTMAADKNYLAIIPELYAHEKGNEGNIEDIVVKTSESIDRILNEYGISKDVNVNIMGCSLGGMIGAYYSLHGQHKVNKMSMLISTLNFESLNHDIFKYTYKNGKEEKWVGAENLRQQLDNIKISDDAGFGNTKIKIYNTRSDPYMDYSKSTIKISRIGNSNIKSELMGYKGHTVKAKEFIESLNWIME